MRGPLRGQLPNPQPLTPHKPHPVLLLFLNLFNAPLYETLLKVYVINLTLILQLMLINPARFLFTDITITDSYFQYTTHSVALTALIVVVGSMVMLMSVEYMGIIDLHRFLLSLVGFIGAMLGAIQAMGLVGLFTC